MWGFEVLLDLGMGFGLGLLLFTFDFPFPFPLGRPTSENFAPPRFFLLMVGWLYRLYGDRAHSNLVAGKSSFQKCFAELYGL